LGTLNQEAAPVKVQLKFPAKYSGTLNFESWVFDGISENESWLLNLTTKRVLESDTGYKTSAAFDIYLSAVEGNVSPEKAQSLGWLDQDSVKGDFFQQGGFSVPNTDYLIKCGIIYL